MTGPKTTLADVAANLFRQRLLLSIMLVSLCTTVMYPLRSYLVVLPFFGEKLLDYSEEEARKTANYLTKELLFVEKGKLMISGDVQQQMTEATSRFGLEKAKIFASTGEILFSTDPAEIGTVNRHDYFHLLVAKGEIFSKIVTKNQNTLEGVAAARDVAEIYIPVMADHAFLGAFELYYDLTKRKRELDSLVWKEALIGSLLSCFMLGVVCVVLLRASRSSMDQKAAEDELRTVNLHLEEIVAEKTRELQVTQEASIQSLAIMAENYDPATGEHLNRIRKLTQLLATLLRESSSYSDYLRKRDSYIEELALASILHDIGKTSISIDILAKPGKLTEEEFTLMKKHTEVAGDVLQQGNRLFVDQFGKDSYLALAGDIARYHHEKWDGSGYPEGLRGQDIPLSARIVAIVDVYDALRSVRPYKEAWSQERAVQLILSESGKHFDPELVRVFERNVERFRSIADAK